MGEAEACVCALVSLGLLQESSACGSQRRAYQRERASYTPPDCCILQRHYQKKKNLFFSQSFHLMMCFFFWKKNNPLFCSVMRMAFFKAFWVSSCVHHRTIITDALLPNERVRGIWGPVCVAPVVYIQSSMHSLSLALRQLHITAYTLFIYMRRQDEYVCVWDIDEIFVSCLYTYITCVRDAVETVKSFASIPRWATTPWPPSATKEWILCAPHSIERLQSKFIFPLRVEMCSLSLSRSCFAAAIYIYVLLWHTRGICAIVDFCSKF